MPTATYRVVFSSPIGFVRIEADERGIRWISFAQDPVKDSDDAPAFLRDGQRQLEEYFAGKRRMFNSLPMSIRATDFQQSVWDATTEIPFGLTRSYGELAQDIGAPDAARAVGTALGRNMIAIIIPCHRIVSASEDQGGYAWGEWRKEWLLKHEGH